MIKHRSLCFPKWIARVHDQDLAFPVKSDDLPKNQAAHWGSRKERSGLGGRRLHDISTGAPRSGECWGSKQSRMLFSSKRNQWGSDLRSFTLELTGNFVSYHFFSSVAWKDTLTWKSHQHRCPFTRKLCPWWAIRSLLITGLTEAKVWTCFNIWDIWWLPSTVNLHLKEDYWLN